MGASALTYLERSAAATPDALAVIDEHRELTYAELRDLARRVGTALAHESVLGRGVTIMMEKGAHALAAQLAALYAGGFYVPVDESIPASRLRQIAEAVGAGPIVVDDTTRALVAEALPGRTLHDFDALAATPADEALLASVASHTLETMPAYTLFTSGSTGTPKGVVISHRAIVAFTDTFVETFGLTAADRLGNQAPFDFDVSTKDIYATLAVGATLVIIPRRLFMQPAELVTYLGEHEVTVLIWAVAALCIVSTYHALDAAALARLRLVMFSGETMPARHLSAWRAALPGATYVNLYGPSEITCNCLYHVLDPADPYEDGIPLGETFPHCEVILAGDDGLPVSGPDAEGELLVRGPSLALGYLGQPELTARAFTQNPARPAYLDRVYHTGDMAARDARGRLFFRGRCDNQVKCQGHRIELEEVDLAFERMEGVDRCRSAFDERRGVLRAFYEGMADPATLTEAARTTLPPYMCPASIRRVDAMPLTKNGKVDRKALIEQSRPRRRKRS